MRLLSPVGIRRSPTKYSGLMTIMNTKSGSKKTESNGVRGLLKNAETLTAKDRAIVITRIVTIHTLKTNAPLAKAVR